MHDYLGLIRRAPRLLAFGFLLNFCSAFGQTYFIAVFGGEVRAEFGLTHGGFGAVYSGATLVSATLLPWIGRVVDRHDLRNVASAVVVGLAGACLLHAAAASLLALGLALLALRLCGQGLMSHTALTAAARGFDADRGKAMGLVMLGFSASEILFPQLAVVGVAIGWRTAWLLSALALLLALLPLLRWLQPAPLRPGPVSREDGGLQPGWTRAQVVRDRRFQFLLPGVIAPSIIATGIFFHQTHIVVAKGWSLPGFAFGFAIFSCSAVVASLLAGGLIDRFGARRLAPVGPLVLAVGALIMALGRSPTALLAGMIVLGVANGTQATTLAALWAELYGTAHYGAIRALGSSLMVFGSAVSPVLFGWLFDVGVGVTAVLAGGAAYAFLGALLMITALLLANVVQAREPAATRGRTTSR